MAGRSTHRITVQALKKLIEQPGLHPDGGGLYLEVRQSGAASWTHRYMVRGRQRYAGLGPYPAVSLAEARRKRAENQGTLAGGVDPLAAKQVGGDTFREVAERYIAAHKAGWSNVKHSDQWASSMATYAYPDIGDRPARDISRDDVLALLDKIWRSKPETASRVRSRIKLILDAASVRAKWSGWTNPALWSHLHHDLPRRTAVAEVTPHAAVPFADAPAVMARLRTSKGMGAMACRFSALTASRPEMVRGARWDEIDGAVWSVPRTRSDGRGSGLKGAPAMRVPLAAEALSILDEMRQARDVVNGDYIFPGAKPNKGMSNVTMAKALAMTGVKATVHGWRSTFRDWAGETTSHAPDVAEASLNHALGGKVRLAYQRGDLFQKRIALMTDWANYLAGDG